MDTELFYNTLTTILGENWSKGKDFRETLEDELLIATFKQNKERVEELAGAIVLIKHLMFEKFKEELYILPSPVVALHKTAVWADCIIPASKMGTHLVEEIRPMIADSYEKLLIPEAVIVSEDLSVYHIPVEQQSIRKAIIVMPTLCNMVGYPVPYPLRGLYATPDLFCANCVLFFESLEGSLAEQIKDFLSEK